MNLISLLDECDGWKYKYQHEHALACGQMQDIERLAMTALDALHANRTAVVQERLEIILSKAKAFQQ